MGVHDRSALHDEAALSTARRKGRVAAAGHLGDERAARSGLDDPEPAVRAAALGALVRLGALSPDDLGRGVTDGSPAVRRRAAEIAWHGGLAGDEVTGAVTPLLEDGDASVVEAACHCLGEVGGAAAARRLEEVARAHGDALCRESAVAALGAIGDPGSLANIISALADRPPIRRRAVLALAPYEGPEVEAALAGALEDRDWQVRQAAEDLTNGRRPRQG